VGGNEGDTVGSRVGRRVGLFVGTRVGEAEGWAITAGSNLGGMGESIHRDSNTTTTSSTCGGIPTNPPLLENGHKYQPC